MTPSRKKQANRQAKQPARPHTSKWLYRAGMLIIAVVYFSTYTKVFDHKPDMNGDNINYYALGNALAAGKGYTNTMSLTETPHSHYPPGYPFIVSLAIRAGAGVIGVKVLNGILLFLSCLILYHLFYRMTRNIYISFFVGLLVALNSHLLRSATIMMSEIPFLFFSSLALLLFFFLLERERCDTKYLLLLSGTAACAVIAYYIRTAGIALVLALAVTLAVILITNVWKNRKTAWRTLLSANRPVWVALLAIVAFFMLCKAPWDIRNSRVGVKSSYMYQLSLQPGGTHISDLNGWVDRVKKNATRYTAKEIPSGLLMEPVSYDKPESAKNWILGAALLLAIAAGSLQLRRNSLILFFYMGGTAVILLFWPDIWMSTRFMSPLIPILLLLMVTGLAKAGRLLLALFKIKKGGGISVAIAIVTVSVFVYPNGSLALSNAADMAKTKSYNATNSTPALVEYLDAIYWVRDNTPGNAFVCTRKPEIFYLYSGGRKSISFPNYATPEEIMSYLTDREIDYIIIDRWFRHAHVTLIPAAQKYPNRFRVIWQTPKPEKDAALTYVLEFIHDDLTMNNEQ